MLSASDSNNFSFFTKKLQFFLITFICLIPSHTIASVYSPKDNGQIKAGDSASLINTIDLRGPNFSYFQVEKQQTMTIDSILTNFYFDRELNPILPKTQTSKSLGTEAFNFSKKIVLIPDSYILNVSDLEETLSSEVYKVNKSSWNLTTISIFIFASIWFMISATLVLFGMK